MSTTGLFPGEKLDKAVRVPRERLELFDRLMAERGIAGVAASIEVRETAGARDRD